MRICICATQVPFVHGGAEDLVETLHRQLLARGFASTVVTLPFSWTPRMQILKSALGWRLVGLDGPAGEPDLVIATRYPSYLVRHPNKVVWLIHQFRQAYELVGTPYSDFDDGPRDRRLVETIHRMDQRAFREARAIFAISHNVARRARRFNGIEAEVVYPPSRLTERLAPGAPGDYVLTVGRLDELKRIDLLLEALRHSRTTLRCAIVGDGPRRGELEEKSRSLGLAERVDFLGRVAEDVLVELYARCLAVYYAPYDEDYGYVTVEAFQSGKPVVTTADSGAVLEFVREGVNGRVHEPGDARGLAASLDHLFTHRDEAAELGARGRTAVVDITWDRAIAALVRMPDGAPDA